MVHSSDQEKQPSAVFASKMDAHPFKLLPSADNPGPGAYDPKDATSTPYLPGANPESNMMSKMPRDARFTGDTIEDYAGRMTGPDVGPGSYEPKTTMDGQLNTIEKRSEQKADLGWSASFISDHLRRIWYGWFGNNDDPLVA